MSPLRHDVRARFSIEKYARVLAGLQRDRATSEEGVLRRMGIDPAEWAEADLAWSTALSEAKRRGQLDWAVRFTSAFFKSRAGVDTDFSPNAPVDGAPAAPAPPVLVPTYQLAEKSAPLATDSSPPQAEGPSTAELDTKALRQGTPKTLPFSAQTPPPPPPPKQDRPLSPAMSGTLEANNEELEAKLAALRAGAGPTQLALPMTVERYVEMSVALAQAADRNALLQAKGYDPARWASIQKSFAVAFERDPELHKRYVAMMKNGLGRPDS